MFQTKIDVIDEIIAHFSKPEADYGLNGDYGQCVYRGPNNKRCAIGCLIPDEIYDPVWDLEILVIKELMDDNYLPNLFSKEIDIDFLISLQDLHDGCALAKKPMSDFLAGL